MFTIAGGILLAFLTLRVLPYLLPIIVTLAIIAGAVALGACLLGTEPGHVILGCLLIGGPLLLFGLSVRRAFYQTEGPAGEAIVGLLMVWFVPFLVGLIALAIALGSH